MIPIVVVEHPRRWPFELEGVEVVPARSYLTDRAWAARRGAAVYNLCRNYRYQSLGYYVSLLAEARGHRPLPSVATVRSLGASPLVRLASDDMDELIQRSLRPLRTARFHLSVYFGSNVAKRYDRLSRALFNQFPAPFLQARFERDERWRLVAVRAVAVGEIPEAHGPFVEARARDFFARPRRARRSRGHRWDLAVLWRADDDCGPSDERAIRRFGRAFAREGIAMDVVGTDEYGRLAEYDALFIRETTRVEHHTYRFARRAEAEGLVVLDDPDSIVRCTNKVYQAEVFARHGLPRPRTLVVHGGNVDEVAHEVGFPCVLKKPDGAFSQGVVRADDPEALRVRLAGLLEESELVVAQEFVPSGFDWRVGVLGGECLWVCRYHMAAGHWQILRDDGGRTAAGKVECVPREEVPDGVTGLALRAAGLMGQGLYGVDLKEVDGRFLVMEVNDNPSIDAGYEDALEGEALYRSIARWYRTRLEERGREGGTA